MWPALAALLPVLAVVALFVGMRRDPDITLVVEDETLRVRLGWWDRLYCLRSGLEVSRGSIAAIAVTPRERVRTSGLRLPGTRVPGIIRAGSYGTGSAREFWDVRRAPDVLVIDLEPGDRYRRLVLEVADPVAEAERLQAALAV